MYIRCVFLMFIFLFLSFYYILFFIFLFIYLLPQQKSYMFFYVLDYFPFFIYCFFYLYLVFYILFFNLPPPFYDLFLIFIICKIIGNFYTIFINFYINRIKSLKYQENLEFYYILNFNRFLKILLLITISNQYCGSLFSKGLAFICFLKFRLNIFL